MSPLLSRLLDHWPARPLRRARFNRRFATRAGGGACRGVFATLDEAARSAPTSAPLGYDSVDAGAMYRDRLDQLFPADYPVVYWLRRWGAEIQHLLDVGGHVGVSYYAFRPYLDPATLPSWTVCDVPSVIAAGAEVARDRGARDLTFVTQAADASVASAFLAAGSLQYLEPTLAELLESLPALPEFVLVNKLPTHPRRSFVTLQHIGVGYCPYRIAAMDQPIEQLAPLGYRLEDRWTNAELSCEIPFEADTGPITYRGYAFRLQ